METEQDILKRYYRVYAEIQLDCIEENILAMQKNVGTKTKIAAVLKTDGYGHGSIPIAKTIKNMVDFFAVATIDEALNIRRHGLENPILILGFLPEDRIPDAIRNGIRPAVFTIDMAEKISARSAELGMKAPIHIKVDTGMGRIGYAVTEESVKEVCSISRLKGIEVEGIFTHFASSDSADKTMTSHQYKKFCDFVSELEEKGLHIPIKHCDNSAGIIDMPEDSMDMVRAGISLYGLYPSA